MRPNQVTFVVEINWDWDHSNTEFGTIVVEDCDQEEIGAFRNIAVPAVSTIGEMTRAFAIQHIRDVADALDGSIEGKRKLVRLYELTDCGKKEAHGNLHLRWTLEPICEFDEQDNPIPLKTGAPS